MFGVGGHKYIYFGIIHRHKIMFIFQCEWGNGLCQWMTCLRFYCDGTLLRVMGEHASQQAAQYRHLLIARCAGMDGKQSISVAYIIRKGRLYFLCHPAALIG